MSVPLVLIESPELRRLITDAVAEAVKGIAPNDKPMTAKEFAEWYRVDVKRVLEWIGDGMPHIKTGDQRGKRVIPSRATAWLEANCG